MREIVHMLNSRDQGVCIDSITECVDECYCVCAKVMVCVCVCVCVDVLLCVCGGDGVCVCGCVLLCECGGEAKEVKAITI